MAAQSQDPLGCGAYRFYYDMLELWEVEDLGLRVFRKLFKLVLKYPFEETSSMVYIGGTYS